MSEDRVIFNDGVLRATLIEPGYVCMEWLTNDRGYLQKTVVRDFYRIEQYIRDHRLSGWLMGSELANTVMHKILEKVGGSPVSRDKEYVYFRKDFPCVAQRNQSLAV